MASVNKSIQFTKNDWIGIKDIKSMNPLCENHSSVMNQGFHDARTNGIDFKEVTKYNFKSDSEIEVDPSEYASAKSFLVDEEDFTFVVEEFKRQLGVERVRISYLARLVIANYRMRLTKETGNEKTVKVKAKTLDGVDLLVKVTNRAAELIKAGDLQKVLEFIGEK
ncbi:MAG: hypothetical protein K6E75_03175 [Lachnospiraceae bacterium]|nr:hypothetical protein [Lachnospiraceae bacterium]